MHETTTQDHVHVLEFIYEDTKYGEKPVGKFCPDCGEVYTLNGSVSLPFRLSHYRQQMVNYSHLRRKRALGLF